MKLQLCRILASGWVFVLAASAWAEEDPATAADASADSVLYHSERGDHRTVLRFAADFFHAADSTACADFEPALALSIAYGQAGAVSQSNAARATRWAIELANSCHGSKSAEAARALKAQGDLHAFRAETDLAISDYRRSIEILREGSDQEATTLSVVLSNLGACERRMGRFALAKEALLQALELQEAEFGAMAPIMVGTLSNLGSVYRETGEYSLAGDAHRQALEILKTNQAPRDENFGRTLSNLALLEADLEDFSNARSRLQSALEIFEARREPDDDLVLDTRLNLASLLNDMGAHDEALDAVAIVRNRYETLLGPDDALLSIPYDVESQILADRGDYAKALARARESIRLVEQAEGLDSFYLSYALSVLTQCHRAMGDDDRALAILERSAAIIESELGSDSPRLVPLWLDQAELSLRLGRREAAELHQTRAASLLDQDWGALHPWHIRAQYLGSSLARLRGEVDTAVELGLEAEAVSRGLLIRAMSSLSERRALRLAERRIRGLDAVLALLEQTPAMAAQAFDGVIRSRGVVLNELVRRQQVLPRSASPALQALWGRSRNTRARFVNLQLRDPGDDGATYRAELESSRAAMEDAERKLAESSELGTNRLLEDLRGFDLVRGSLPSGSSLVAYTQYKDEGRSYLGAFTLLAGESQPHWQSLGTVDVIEDELRLWREQAAYGEGAPRGIVSRSRDKSVRFESYVKVAQELRERIWDPLPESIRESAQVYLVADGPLHSLSFDGLVDSEGRFLVESDTRFQWIASERSLFPTHNNANSGVLAVGDPTLPRPRGSESGRCSHELLSSLAQLSAARDEARTVARIWEAQEAVTLLVGDDATESHLIAAAPGVRLLHLATHGFILDSDCFSTEFGLAANHPLVRTGILVAPTSGGSSEAQEDGWWTAQEIASLDLRGVECVVLSACGTALGERRSDGEGVHGLRRALEIAGAEATIVSLWAVDDRATEDWMSRLHRISAERKTPLLRAAREAHRETIASRRTAGLSVHPFYWAGFVSVAATDALR